MGSVGRETMPPERGIAAEGSKEWHTDTVDGKAAEKNAFCYWRKEQHNLAMNEGTNDRHIKIKSPPDGVAKARPKAAESHNGLVLKDSYPRAQHR